LISRRVRDEAVGGAAPTELIGGGGKTFALGLTPGWITGNAELKAELSSVSQEVAVQRSGAEIVDQAARIVEVVAARDLVPVLVVDDSDAWFNVPGREDRMELATGFFENVPRFIAEELSAGVVIATHESYLGLEGFKAARGFIETLVRVPDVPNASGISAILERRLEAHDCGPLSDVFREGIVETLHAHYSGAGQRDLRAMLLLCHTALRNAAIDGADAINLGHIEKAIAESLG
jgi:hypothetical protein